MEFTSEQEVMNTVISRCWEDDAFKQELLASPIEANQKRDWQNHPGTPKG